MVSHDVDMALEISKTVFLVYLLIDEPYQQVIFVEHVTVVMLIVAVILLNCLVSNDLVIIVYAII